MRCGYEQVSWLGIHSILRGCEMVREDLGRRFILDVTADGTVLIRERGPQRIKDLVGLPVYSTDTAEEAESIRVTHCRRANDGSGLYRLTHWKVDQTGYGSIDSLPEVSDLFRATHEQIREARK